MKTFLASAVAAVLALSFSAPAFATGIDVPCIQGAIETRENSIISALDTYNVTIKNALIVRKDALKAAWTITNKDQRKDALKAAKTAMENARKDAQKVKKDANKIAGTVFKTTMKNTCHQVGNDTATDSNDGQL